MESTIAMVVCTIVDLDLIYLKELEKICNSCNIKSDEFPREFQLQVCSAAAKCRGYLIILCNLFDFFLLTFFFVERDHLIFKMF